MKNIILILLALPALLFYKGNDKDEYYTSSM